MLTFAEIWERIVERPAAEFLVTPDMRLDYGGFAELLRRFSSTFDRSGLATGDRVLILTRNEPLAIAAFAAALLDGLVPVIMAPDSPTQRVASIASSVTARLAVLDDERCLEGWGSDLKLIKVPAKPAVKKGGWLLARGQMSEGVRLADLPAAGGLVEERREVFARFSAMLTSGLSQGPGFEWDADRCRCDRRIR